LCKMSYAVVLKSLAAEPYLLSKRTWADEWHYQKLVAASSVKTVHQLEREKQYAAKQAREAAKRLVMKEAAAEARRKVIEEKEKAIEEAKLRMIQRGRKHKKRAAKKAIKKAAKKEFDSLLNQIDEEMDEVDLEALEEELRVLEEEDQKLLTVEKQWAVEQNNNLVEQCSGKEKEEIPTVSVEEEVILSVDIELATKMTAKQARKIEAKRCAKSCPNIRAEEDEGLAVAEEERETTDEVNVAEQRQVGVVKKVQNIDAAKKLVDIRRTKVWGEEKISEAKFDVNEGVLTDLKAKAVQAEFEMTRAENKAISASEDVAIYLIEVERDESEAIRTAEVAKEAEEKAKLAFETARQSREEYKILMEYESSMRSRAEIARVNYMKALDELSRGENDQSECVVKQEEAKEVDPFLNFIKETVRTKSLDLECPVCLEEASSPIYSCPARGHVLCSSCRPTVTSCPECREWLGTEWIRHRFAERSAEELMSLREKLMGI